MSTPSQPSGSGPPTAGAAAGGQAPLGFDPGRDKKAMEEEKALEFRKRYANIDLPPEAYKVEHATPFTRRPGFNNSGQAITVEVNQFAIRSMEGVTVHQYDVMVSPEPSRTAFYNVLWQSNAVQDRLKSLGPHMWIHDGRRLAWSRASVKQKVEIVVDMDKEKGQASRPERSNTFTVAIRPATSMNMSLVNDYFSGAAEWNPAILECLNFVDHLIRMGPTSRGLIKIKRNFFDPSKSAVHFDDMVVAKKGIYAAIAMAGVLSNKSMMGLALNVDVANTTFWNSCKLTDMMDHIVRVKEGGRWRQAPKQSMWEAFKPQRAGNDVWEPSSCFRHLKSLHKLNFRVSHMESKGSRNQKLYKILKFEFDRSYGANGATAETIRFVHEGQEITVQQYFAKKYHITLKESKYPCVVTGKNGVFPPEICTIAPDQRYEFKLTPEQTSEMIKFAVTRPAARKSDIMQNVTLLDWQRDKYLKDFGVVINPQMTKTNGRLLAAPKVVFANGQINPGVSGRWDLRGKHFMFPKTIDTSSWAIVSYSRRIEDHSALERFANTFKTSFRNHGCQIGDNVFIKPYRPQSVTMAKFPDQVMADIRGSPIKSARIVFVVLPDKSAERYESWKKGFECKFALLTQCLQDVQVLKCQPQYVSNVCMKVNAKLGGATAKAVPQNQPNLFQTPTIIFGVDVRHPSPGVPFGSSIAAVTMSKDRDAATYLARADTNGRRVEILSRRFIEQHVFNSIGLWRQIHKTDPKHIFYLRDGVGNSQFSQVLHDEIGVLKQLLSKRLGPQNMPKFTVVVAQKRHHVRFFPDSRDKVAADRNGNVHPGTLIERDVTHPFHYDFFLSSHSAIQGTARPTHYHVILDEANMSPEALQQLLYVQCYQYVRSTTPVSIHPAIYYAHLACTRSMPHENPNADPAKAESQSGMFPIGMDSSVHPQAKQFFVNQTMWYA